MTAQPVIVIVRRPADEHCQHATRERVAVASLEEARGLVVGLVQPFADAETRKPEAGPVADICLALMRKDWSGGSVSLPDGTEIEVAPTTIWDLAQLSDTHESHYLNGDDAGVIVAFNAAQDAVGEDDLRDVCTACGGRVGERIVSEGAYCECPRPPVAQDGAR